MKIFGKISNFTEFANQKPLYHVILKILILRCGRLPMHPHYLSLHNFGKQGEQAWMPFDGGGDNPSSSFKRGERRTEGEQGGARD